ncbi:hypothetical protein [Porphyromonas levii]|uniref:Uncharacterized protein n=1 Tax=Porphyromonas levii TaxID=28114 RepID=A0A4Y8WMT6_9PORP|nr:hypothetical protein [Porphyromonas levii]MBR8702729.1 hypothetical protein [Porphyromonas levii]MBR8763417.1 hypothetical protein [Porphyromonas levii]MBR8770165.1 hypothetical protein [Porphyromonas levii]MBR8784862.1 hypothetical protein [Porphyromonas levii]TFH94409.1 hypothetical protein E4P47_07595 [Porphyromonas levii]
MEYFVVRYSGAFGYIKPWSAVRDGKTYSQQFLTPSIVEGMEKKLFPDLLHTHGIHKILRHKLSCNGISPQQEKTQAPAWQRTKRKGDVNYSRALSILVRGVMLSPVLYLGFASEEDAIVASRQHLCLCRNEDIILPEKEIKLMTEEEFEALPGFELRFEQTSDPHSLKYPDSFIVGYNRFDNDSPMYGRLEIDGKDVWSR